MAAVAEVIDSTGYILGPRVESLEQALAAYCATGPSENGHGAAQEATGERAVELQGIGVSSGTDALLVALMALEIGPGDLVLTTPYSFFATMGCILRLGAQPVFVDIDPQTYNIDPAALEEFFHTRPAEAARVKACIPVHLYGQAADMGAVLSLCARHGIPVVEDAAQAIGTAVPITHATVTDHGFHEVSGRLPTWRRAGSLGVAGCFSFFPSKNLGGIGDGGLVLCRDEALAEKIRILRVHGGAPKYHHGLVGGNFRLDPIQAVVLEIKLRHLPAWHAARRANADRYRQMFQTAGLLEEGVVLPEAVYRQAAEADGVQDYHIYNQFVIRVRRRDELMAHLQQAGIGCEIYYPVPLHKQGCVAHLACHAEVFPEAERAARETLALPIYPELTVEMQQEVVAAVSSFYRKGAVRN